MVRYVLSVLLVTGCVAPVMDQSDSNFDTSSDATPTINLSPLPGPEGPRVCEEATVEKVQVNGVETLITIPAACDPYFRDVGDLPLDELIGVPVYDPEVEVPAINEVQP